MARRSDVKAKMVEAAKQLIRERGHGATAFADVLERSGAPRGSVYYHFPEGKSQLVIEAAQAHAHEQVQIIDRVAQDATSAAGFIDAYLGLARDGMAASGYSRGCGIAPLVIEGSEEPDEMGEASRRGFSEITSRLAFHLVTFGVDQAAARVLADAVMAGAEGALVTSRALRSPAPWDSLRVALAASVAAVSPKASRRAQG